MQALSLPLAARLLHIGDNPAINKHHNVIKIMGQVPLIDLASSLSFAWSLEVQLAIYLASHTPQRDDPRQ